jgi:hypothetical protein
MNSKKLNSQTAVTRHKCQSPVFNQGIIVILKFHCRELEYHTDAMTVEPIRIDCYSGMSFACFYMRY